MVSKEQVQNWLNSREVALATPHNQRSNAYLKSQLHLGSWLSIEDLIWQVESTISTPVQTAVKREDEQEFARLNGSNLLFYEDAARRVKAWLEKSECIDSYWYKIEHQESLHAHNAVVIDSNY
ncbi:hypothetical protein MACH26_16130 [Planctobacterium marinum]|uniref:GTP cyclohydrolase I n=1 Tax=Planctobacterium marinum TaxID=1631968 RepID=A0AA48KRG4_9ALTE|nr:hypothetical protein MACH26_16130 [Planctobacterium marinum]